MIKKISDLLEINVCFFKQSQLTSESASSEMLASLCKRVEASVYLSGIGAADYMNEECFQEQDIQVIYQEQKYGNIVENMKKYSIIHYLCAVDSRNWSTFNVAD